MSKTISRMLQEITVTGLLNIHIFFLFVGAEGLRIEFDRQCSTERRHDPLTIMDGANRIVSVRSGDDRKTVKPYCHQAHVKPRDQK